MLVFIVPFYNCSDFINDCVSSLLNQEDPNFRVVFADDCSTDNGSDKIPDDPRFVKFKNTSRLTALGNIHNAIMSTEMGPEDVICLLDGDDTITWDAVRIVNSLYNDSTLLTYGQYRWPSGAPGHCAQYTEESFKQLRRNGYQASHLRTFKRKLYDKLVELDPTLECYRNKEGKFYEQSYDVAIMTPLMEIAGFENVKFNHRAIYNYRLHPQNDHVRWPNKQRNVATEIFSKKPFPRCF